MKPSKALRKGGRPSKKRMLGGKKKKPDGPLEKKKKGASLNPVDRSKLRKLLSKRQGKENESLPAALEKQPKKKGADAAERKRRLSGSSVDSAASKRSKKKRVSFANQLEHTKMLDSFDDSVALELSASTPGRSILRRRQQQQQLAAEEKKALEKKRLDAETEREAVEPTDAAERPQPAPVGSPPDDEPPMKIKSKPKLQVTKKMKEKLLAMPRKERKAFIRQLKAKRKPNFELGAQCKVLWEKIRSGKTPKDEKDTLVHELCGLVKGKAKTLIYAHDTCRVIECLMALDRPGIRTMLFEELKPEIVRMAKSKYARFFVWKMLKYGTPQQRSTICEAFRGHVTTLLRQKFGSEVLEFAYNDYANAQQRSDIVAELYGREFTYFRPGKPVTLQEIIANEPTKKPAIMRNMEELLKDIVDKPALKHSLTHRLLIEFMEHCSAEQRTEMIDAIKERVVEIIHTRDGAHVALHCIWYGTAKERKIIVKSFKGLAVKTCHEEYGRLVLMAIFDCVDDTVLVKKCIVQDIANDIKQVVTNKYGVKVVHYLCHPRDKRHFLKETVQLLAKGDDNPHSKKEKKDRYSELWECVSSALLTFIAANMRDLIFETSTSLLVLNVLEESGEGNLFDRRIPDEDRLQCYKAIAEIARDEFIPCNMEERFHLVEHKNASFVVAHLLKSDKTRTDTEVTLSAQLAELTTDQLASWTACNKGCFVLLDMYDSGNAKAAEAVKSAVTSSHKRLEGYSSQGAKLLLAKVAT